jgi:CRP-like cAMP-binding protein
VIVSGVANVAFGTRVVGRLGEGRFFGESPMLDRGPETMTVTSSTPMRVYVAGIREFGALLAIPSVARGLLRGIAARDRDLYRMPDALPVPAPARLDRMVVLAR